MKALLCLLSVSSVSLAQSPTYVVSPSEITYDNALVFCESQHMTLTNEVELSEIYQGSIGADGNSALRRGKNTSDFWIKEEKSWGVDAIAVLPPLLVIPVPSRQPKVMRIYRYKRKKPETMYVFHKAPWLHGNLSFAICKDR